MAAPPLAAVLFLVYYACAAAREPAGPPPAPPTPSAPGAHVSPDGRFRWVEGEGFVTVAAREGLPERKVKLPPARAGTRRRVLFAGRSSRFCLLEEEDSELGLHLGSRRGNERAKALVVASKLHLLDSGGRVLWSRRLPERAIVGRAADARSLRIANDGTLALLLQDVDPYGKARPLLLAIAPNGRDLLSLDSASWTRVSEFLLSPEGAFLAVRGFGLLQEEEDWSKALGYYPLRSGKPRLHPLPKAEEGPSLVGFDAQGWVCCAREGGRSYAFGPLGPRAAVEEKDVPRRFSP